MNARLGWAVNAGLTTRLPIVQKMLEQESKWKNEAAKQPRLESLAYFNTIDMSISKALLLHYDLHRIHFLHQLVSTVELVLNIAIITSGDRLWTTYIASILAPMGKMSR
jgi:hypothetical protein